MLHILDRFLIHLFAGPGLILAVTFLLAMLGRKLKYSWLPRKPLPTTIVAALLVLPVAFAREPFDVGQGGTVVKSYFDLAGWCLTCMLTPWALWRVNRWWNQVC